MHTGLPLRAHQARHEIRVADVVLVGSHFSFAIAASCSVKSRISRVARSTFPSEPSTVWPSAVARRRNRSAASLAAIIWTASMASVAFCGPISANGEDGLNDLVARILRPRPHMDTGYLFDDP